MTYEGLLLTQFAGSCAQVPPYLTATLRESSIPVSAIFMKPFFREGVEFTGLSLKTLTENLKPHLTKGAAGSQLKGRETFQDLFGILFPATGGIFA